MCSPALSEASAETCEKWSQNSDAVKLSQEGVESGDADLILTPKETC